MRAALLSPPGLSPFSPPLGIMALASYLRREGIDVLTVDVSIEALHFFLSPKNVKKQFAAAKRALDRLEASNPLKSRLADIAFRSEEIESIVEDVWREDRFFISKKNFDHEIKALNDALIFCSLNYLPTVFSLNSTEAAPELARNPSLNPHYAYYREVLIPKLREYKPDLVGISISYETQAVFGLSLINEITETLKVPVAVGGSFFSILCTEIHHGEIFTPDAPLDELSDITQLLQPYGIIGEGEEPLLKLCKSIMDNKPGAGIPGVIYYNRTDNTLKVNGNREIVHPDRLPVIEPEGIPLNRKYLTPITIAPLLSSRGCYWNKCTFCSHAGVIDSKWREMPVNRLIENLKLYKNKYNVDLISFCDESMSPSMLKALSQRIIKEGIRINFGTMMRFERPLLDIIEIAAAAGCKFLALGLESGAPRVLSLMNKGYPHEIAQQIIDRCRKNGIAVELFTMFGFPSETRAEAGETISFVERNTDALYCFRASPWMLSAGSEIYYNLQKYGIIKADNFDPYNPHTYKVNSGIDFESALEIIGSLQKHPSISGKLITYGHDGFSEEYFAVKLLLTG